MIGQTIAIARNTFLESVRQPIFFVLLMAGALLQVMTVLMAAYSMGYTDTAEVSSDNKMLLDMGLATAFVIATLLAAFISTAVLSREIENKTALTVISKPIGRPMFILGKYLGATAAVLVATVVLLVFFMLALRQGALTTARDTLDAPVAFFGTLAIVLAVGLGTWGNYFYGWVFSSTTVFTLAPAIVGAWLLTLVIGKNWGIQPVMTDIRPQILLASLCVLAAMPVLVSIAIAASTRLGQVMTIVVCAGAFMLGLLSNHFIGRFAFDNQQIARVFEVEAERDRDANFSDPGDTYRLRLDGPPQVTLRPGASIYYGPSPNGIGLVVPEHAPFEGDPSRERDIYETTTPAIVVAEVRSEPPTIMLINAGGLEVRRPPMVGDSLFLTPTRVNPAAWAAWSVVPNMQFFWLVDAVTQAHDIPPRYVLLVAGYALAQIVGLLSIAVLLFQTRDVG